MPAVTFGGIGSGMDIEGLIEGLVGIARQPLSRIKSREASARAAITSLSDIGGLLAELETAAGELDTLQKVGSYKATSSNEDALAISASGGAQPGTYEVKVVQLAHTARRYTQAFDTSNQSLNQSGTLTLQVGTGDLQSPDGDLLVGAATASLEIVAEDTLDDIVAKINESGIRVKASTFFDGSQYRLQLRGLDAGSDNKLTVDGNGLTLGLTDEGNIVHEAQNALVEIDGFTVESKTNQVSQSISGITLALSKVTEESFTINIEADPEAMSGKVEGFITAYNDVINKVHSSAGFGAQKAGNPYLKGDSTLRRITAQLSRQLSSSFGEGASTTLASLGIQLNNNGTLKLDSTKLGDVLANDPTAITTILAGTDSADGIMDIIRDLARSISEPNTGSLSIREEGLEARARAFSDQLAREEERLGRMEERLRKTFTAMDGTVAAYNAQLQQLL